MKKLKYIAGCIALSILLGGLGGGKVIAAGEEEHYLEAKAVGGMQKVVEYGESALLQVEVESDDLSKVHFAWDKGTVSNDYWVDFSRIPGEESDSLTTDAIEQFTVYRCIVSDEYGNYKMPWFEVSVENHLELNTILPKEIIAPEGETVTLSVVASADDESGMRYQWKEGPHTEQGTDYHDRDENISEITVSVQENKFCSCTVFDKYGGRKGILFSVKAGDKLLGDANGDGVLNRADRMYLSRAIAGWKGYAIVCKKLADSNGDGEVNRADRMYLARALSGWEGFSLAEKSECDNCILLSDGTVIKPGETITIDQLKDASFVVGGKEKVWYAFVASEGAYHAAEDPDPDWAYEEEYKPGDRIPLSNVVGYFDKPYQGLGPIVYNYDSFSIELRGTTDSEFVFYVEK